MDLYVLERAFKSAHSADGEGLVRCPLVIHTVTQGHAYVLKITRCPIQVTGWLGCRLSANRSLMQSWRRTKPVQIGGTRR